MATIHVLPLRMNLFQNLKCQTGNSFLLWKLSEKNEQHKCHLHPKSYQALTCETKSFTLKAYGYAELQSQKCQTGEKYFLFITLKTFGEEWTTKRFSSSKSHQALTCENKSFTLKAYGPADRITPKSEVSNWRLEKLSGEEQQNVFFIEKLPSVNVRNQEFSC